MSRARTLWPRYRRRIHHGSIFSWGWMRFWNDWAAAPWTPLGPVTRPRSAICPTHSRRPSRPFAMDRRAGDCLLFAVRSAMRNLSDVPGEATPIQTAETIVPALRAEASTPGRPRGSAFLPPIQPAGGGPGKLDFPHQALRSPSVKPRTQEPLPGFPTPGRERAPSRPAAAGDCRDDHGQGLARAANHGTERATAMPPRHRADAVRFESHGIVLATRKPRSMFRADGGTLRR